MSKVRLGGISALALVATCAAPARAEDISTKKMFIKDHSDAAKRQVQVLSKDPGVLLSKADDPRANGAAFHIYSATDDLCVVLAAGSAWVSKQGSWKYKNKSTKNSVQVKNGKLLVTIKSGVGYSLADDGSQGAVNVQVRLGTGTRFCMRCPGNKKDKATKFLGANCAAAPCEPERAGLACDTVVATTTTTTAATSSSSSGSSSTSTTLVTTTSTTSTSGAPTPSTSTATTTTLPTGGTVLKGALTA